MTEDEFIALLRPLAGDGARELRDDAAVLTLPKNGDLVLTHDVIVEGVHFRSEDAAEDVAWKLVAVNLSDLAAKGATPLGVLLGYPLSDDGWDRGFAAGLVAVLGTFDCPLLGGDTVKAAGPRSLSLTAIGSADNAPSRSGARPGDELWVTGTIGLAGQGLRGEGGAAARSAYLRPQPRLTEGRALAPLVTAMMDVSDGLLIDAQRMAAASGVQIGLALDAVPVAGDAMAAVTAGDDYELLFTLSPGAPCPVAATRIGSVCAGQGLVLTSSGAPVPLPARLGYRHG
ncbi:MAG TPA: thiamine-phosphate kinase [Sphingomonas sp.]|nr:thiamine-phosphate kinase [Sphingomonas sp.]